MFGEWRVCLVLLVLWCGSRDVVSGGYLESLRPQYLEIIGTGQGENEGCDEAPDGWYKNVSVFAGKSADQVVKDRRATDPDGSKAFTDDIVAGEVKISLLNNYDLRHSEDSRCIVREGLVCSRGKCIKCDKAEDKTACGFIKTIVDKEGSQAPSKKSEGRIKGTSEGKSQGGIKGTSSKESQGGIKGTSLKESEGKSEGGRVKTPVGVVVVSVVIGFVFAL